MKTVLISGCSSGIGLATALHLRQLGFRVLVTARQEIHLKQLKDQGFEAFPLELSDPLSVRELVKSVREASQGRLDALVNNAGFAVPGAIEDLSRDQLKAQFETNVFGSIDLIQHFIPLMRAQGHGHIIQIGSILGIVTMPFRGAYCASKYALESLIDAMRMELKGSGIEFVLIEPGPIQSNFRKNARRVFDQASLAKSSLHAAQYKKLYEERGPEIPFSLQPEAVAKIIEKALKSTRPNARYYVTFPAYFMMFARRLLPARALDWLMERLGR